MCYLSHLRVVLSHDHTQSCSQFCFGKASLGARRNGDLEHSYFQDCVLYSVNLVIVMFVIEMQRYFLLSSYKHGEESVFSKAFESGRVARRYTTLFPNLIWAGNPKELEAREIGHNIISWNGCKCLVQP